MKYLVFSSILLLSMRLISSDDCNVCRKSGTNRFACVGYSSFQFCSVQSGKWVPVGATLPCGDGFVCSLKSENPCVNATTDNQSACRQVCTTKCGSGDLYTCTSPNKFQICASQPALKNIACPDGQLCTDRFCQPSKIDGVSTRSSCSDDLTKINLETFCDDKVSGSYLDQNDADCRKFVICKYDDQKEKLVATNGEDCVVGKQFSQKFGNCVATRQDGCPPLPSTDGTGGDQ